MSPQESRTPPHTGRAEPDAVSPPAPSLRAYAEFLRAAGRPYVLEDDGAAIWAPGARGELQRLPMACTAPADEAVLREVLSQRGTWIAGYIEEPGPSRAANCFDYLCFDRSYDVTTLSKHARRDIRRGRRGFTVRRTSWQEVAEHGLRAYSDTEARHGHAPPGPRELQELARQFDGCPCVEAWGAWDESGLAAWIRVVKADDWAMIAAACSRHDALPQCPNNAVVYRATRTFFAEENRRSVSFGVSSLQATSNVASLHRFKLRMGFEPASRHRRFAVHGLIRPLLRSRPASWLWDRLAGARASSATLSKVAGLSRILSGRDRNPLAWAEGLE